MKPILNVIELIPPFLGFKLALEICLKPGLKSKIILSKIEYVKPILKLSEKMNPEDCLDGLPEI